MTPTVISHLCRKKLVSSSTLCLRSIRPSFSNSAPNRLLSSSRAMASHSTMLQSNRLKQAFQANKGPSMGVWQMIPGSNVSRLLARAGAEWVMVDCEHGNIDGRKTPGHLLMVLVFI